MKEGDRNTEYFHKVANAHKRSSNIDKMEIQDEPVRDPEKIKAEIIGFYQRLYSETIERRLNSNLINCPVITEAENDALQKDFEEQKVLSCLKMCATDKAPGPDGYTKGFFIKCWEVVKRDIMETFKNFHDHGIFEGSFNNIRCFDPKEDGSQRTERF